MGHNFDIRIVFKFYLTKVILLWVLVSYQLWIYFLGRGFYIKLK